MPRPRMPRVVRPVNESLNQRVNRMPIRLRLALTFAGVMVVLFGVLFLALYLDFASGLNDGVTSSLATRAADLSVRARESDAQLKANPVLPAATQGFAQILNPDGTVLAATSDLGGSPLLNAKELARTRQGLVRITRGKASLRAQRVAGTGNVLVVGLSLADRDSALGSLRTLLFLVGPILLVVASLAGYVVAAKALAPVETMRRRADQIRGGESGARLPVPPSRDEIQRLGDTLNEMLSRVEEVVGRGRAFVSGASHELRTPLTILQLELDDALEGESTREELEAAIGSAREEVKRLTSLTEDLLVIAQTDQQRLPINHQRFEVHGAMRVVADRYAHLETLVGRTVTVLPGPPIWAEADITRLDQALSNMVHNALRYGEGEVLMRARQHAGQIELHVLDRGPGFPADFVPRAFERFSRADPARSRGGTGLGLSIVKAIAEAHGGRAEAENRPGGGAHVWLTLPGSPRAGHALRGAPELGGDPNPAPTPGGTVAR